MKRNLGFTLAEVLITLAIIGVVAAMTVPTLMTSTRGKEYEVGAQKALSTLANSITMRIALEGVAPANYMGSLGQYLLMPPGTRAGEQAALPSTFVSVGATGTSVPYGPPIPFVANIVAASATFKDGMIAHFPAAAAAGAGVNGCSDVRVGGGCMVTIDTNGTKGPSRSIPGRQPGTAASGGACADLTTSTTGDDNTTVPATNACPDIIQLRVRDTVVEPANQRTRNIMATGNAMIDR